jgi:hypothetical protein
MSELQNITYLTKIKQRQKITCRYDTDVSKERVDTDKRTGLMEGQIRMEKLCLYNAMVM